MTSTKNSLNHSLSSTAPTADWFAPLTVTRLRDVVAAFGCSLPRGLKRDVVLAQVALMAAEPQLVGPLVEAMYDDGYGVAVDALLAANGAIPLQQAEARLGSVDDDSSAMAAVVEVGLAVIATIDGEAMVAMPPVMRPVARTVAERRSPAATAAPAAAPAPAPAAAPAPAPATKTPRSAAPSKPPAPVAPVLPPAPRTVVRRQQPAESPAPASASAASPEPAPAAPAPVAAPLLTPRPAPAAAPLLTPRPAPAAAPLLTPRPAAAVAPRPAPAAATTWTAPPLLSPPPPRAAAAAAAAATWEVLARRWALPDGSAISVAVVVDTYYGRVQGTATRDTGELPAAVEAVNDAIRRKGLPALLRVETQGIKRAVLQACPDVEVHVGRPGPFARRVARTTRPPMERSR